MTHKTNTLTGDANTLPDESKALTNKHTTLICTVALRFQRIKWTLEQFHVTF